MRQVPNQAEKPFDAQPQHSSGHPVSLCATAAWVASSHFPLYSYLSRVIPCRAVADQMPPTKPKISEDDPRGSQRSTKQKPSPPRHPSEARRAIAAAYGADPGALADPAGDHAGLGRQATGGEPTSGVSATGTPASTQQANGVMWQWAPAAELSADTAAAVRAMLLRDMQPLYGAAEWPAEWRRKQRNVLHRDSRHVRRLPPPHLAMPEAV